MNADLIQTVAKETLAGTISFPAAIQKLTEAGVEYYHVDYLGRRKTFYGADGGRVTSAIDYDDLPEVAPELDVNALRADILDSQTKSQKYRDFSRRAMAAGVQGYFAFLRGRRVTYLGRAGDQHTEWFPGSGPAAK
jgi:uncharacterized protein YbcV (DUF1398 family)